MKSHSTQDIPLNVMNENSLISVHDDASDVIHYFRCCYDRCFISKVVVNTCKCHNPCGRDKLASIAFHPG